MVFRIFVEKRPDFSSEAVHLLEELKGVPGIGGLEGVRILHRYDVEHLDSAACEAAKYTVFSNPQTDVVWNETFPQPRNLHSLLAVETLPGLVDRHAESCTRQLQQMTGTDCPLVRYARVYLLEGWLSEEDLNQIRACLINPMESREAPMDKPDTLA